MWIGWQVHKMAYQGAALDRGQSLIPIVALLMLAGLFLLDDWHAVYLWVGRRPTAADTDDPESVVAGTANTRFTTAKICAMRTALDYCSGILLSVLLPLKVRPYGTIQIRLLHTFNGPLSGTTWVSRYRKSKTNLDFTESRDSEWQWHQPGHMQVCISLQTDNHTSTPPLSFLQAGCPSCHPTDVDRCN